MPEATSDSLLQLYYQNGGVKVPTADLHQSDRIEAGEPALDPVVVEKAKGGPEALLTANPPGTAPDPDTAFAWSGPVGKATVPAGTRAPAPQGGREMLPEMMLQVWQVESGNQQTRADGSVVMSPKGAIGVSQLMPDTAKSLGVDPYNEEQNREGGQRMLGQMYDKYGDWTKSLMAYNWGPGNVDNWLAKGSPPAAVPLETRRYIGAILGNQSLAPSPGEVQVDKRKSATMDDIRLLYEDQTKAPARGPGEPGRPLVFEDEHKLRNAIVDPESGTIMGYSKEEGDKRDAFILGAIQGARGLLAGPIQAGLELAAPGAAQGFTEKLNEMDAPFKEQAGAHPVLHFAGEVSGLAVGILATRGLLGATGGPAAMARYMPQVIKGMPQLVKTAAVGAAFGGTAYNEKPEEASRLAQAALGGVIGILGSGAARLIGGALGRAQEGAVVQTYLQQLSENYGSLTPSTSRLKDLIVARLATLTKLKDKRYTVRNQAGQEIEGYPSGLADGTGISKAMSVAMGESKEAGVFPTPGTQAVARRVDAALGLPERRVAQREHELSVTQYERAVADREREIAKYVPANMGATAALQMRKEVETMLGPGPAPPGPFLPAPITGAEMSAAREVINAQLQRAKDVKTKTQLGMLRTQLNAEAAATAAEAGVDVASFERKSKAAANFMREQLGPIRDMFGRKSPQQLAVDLDNAKVYDMVIRTVKSGNTEAAERLGVVLGPQGKEAAVQAIYHEMLTDAQIGVGGKVDPTKISKWFADNRIGLRSFLGRAEYDKLEGISRIAENMLTPTKGRGGLIAGIAKHPFILAIGAMNAMHGNVGWGMMEMFAPVAYESMKRVGDLTRSIPRLAMLLPQAARTEINSPAMDRIINQIEQVFRASSAVLSRQVPQSTGGEPATTAGRIAGPVLEGVGAVPGALLGGR